MKKSAKLLIIAASGLVVVIAAVFMLVSLFFHSGETVFPSTYAYKSASYVTANFISGRKETETKLSQTKDNMTAYSVKGFLDSQLIGLVTTKPADVMDMSDYQVYLADSAENTLAASLELIKPQSAVLSKPAQSGSSNYKDYSLTSSESQSLVQFLTSTKPQKATVWNTDGSHDWNILFTSSLNSHVQVSLMVHLANDKTLTVYQGGRADKLYYSWQLPASLSNMLENK